ncbi:MAG: hypothetical protein FVQ81_12900 [Candidatus Glassbacteria bacterium]|nr:hypothetical protein [Candidatus Glassbacteria bacterium]
MRFTIHQEADIYEESDYGEPPQVAIWLEDAETGAKQTVSATYRTATGDFYGKVECPISLPAWVMVWREETGNEGFPTPRQSAPEAITAATSLERLVSASATGIQRGRKLFYYIELNVAADFNAAFPLEGENMQLDYQHNGQPSLIYRGEIIAEPGNLSTPEPWARTAQYQFTGEVIEDLEGMESALQCFSKIEVEVVGE